MSRPSGGLSVLLVMVTMFGGKFVGPFVGEPKGRSDDGEGEGAAAESFEPLVFLPEYDGSDGNT